MPFDCEPDRWRDFYEPPKKLTVWERLQEFLYVVAACFPGFVFLVGNVLVSVGLITTFFAPQTGGIMCATGLGCWIFFVVVFILHHDFGIRLFPE